MGGGEPRSDWSWKAWCPNYICTLTWSKGINQLHISGSRPSRLQQTQAICRPGEEISVAKVFSFGAKTLILSTGSKMSTILIAQSRFDWRHWCFLLIMILSLICCDVRFQLLLFKVLSEFCAMTLTQLEKASQFMIEKVMWGHCENKKGIPVLALIGLMPDGGIKRTVHRPHTVKTRSSTETLQVQCPPSSLGLESKVWRTWPTLENFGRPWPPPPGELGEHDHPLPRNHGTHKSWPPCHVKLLKCEGQSRPLLFSIVIITFEENLLLLQAGYICTTNLTPRLERNQWSGTRASHQGLAGGPQETNCSGHHDYPMADFKIDELAICQAYWTIIDSADWFWYSPMWKSLLSSMLALIRWLALLFSLGAKW